MIGGPVEDEYDLEKLCLSSEAREGATQMPEWGPPSGPPGVKDFN